MAEEFDLCCCGGGIGLASGGENSESSDGCTARPVGIRTLVFDQSGLDLDGARGDGWSEHKGIDRVRSDAWIRIFHEGLDGVEGGRSCCGSERADDTGTQPCVPLIGTTAVFKKREEIGLEVFDDAKPLGDPEGVELSLRITGEESATYLVTEALEIGGEHPTGLQPRHGPLGPEWIGLLKVPACNSSD